MAEREDFSFKPLPRKALLRLKKQLEHPDRLLRPIGMLLLADAQRAFKEQRLGEHKWPERYPSQAPPKVNVAGIVSDLAQGRKNFPRRRFEGRPAGIDTGTLLRSLTSGSKAVSVKGYEIAVGSTVEYAQKFHDGGESRQAVTKSMKDLLAEWMTKKRKQRDRSRKRQTPLTAELAGMQKLGFLFGVDEIETTSPARPFLGVTDEAKRRIIRYLEFKLSPPLQGGMFQEGTKI